VIFWIEAAYTSKEIATRSRAGADRRLFRPQRNIGESWDKSLRDQADPGTSNLLRLIVPCLFVTGGSRELTGTKYRWKPKRISSYYQLGKCWHFTHSGSLRYLT
jgi:hypothetical protein